MTDPQRLRSSRCTICSRTVDAHNFRRCSRCRTLLCTRPSCGIAHDGPCRRRAATEGVRATNA